MDRPIFLYLACLLAGFALIKMPLGPLHDLEPLVSLVGILAVLVFAVVLIIHGLIFLFKRGF